MSDAILELFNELHNKGISWGAAITILLFFNKIQRNKEFRLRDQRVERNQRRIMEHLGVEGEWESSSQKNGLKSILQRLISYLRKAMKHLKRRMNMLTSILKANLSKKLVSVLVSIGVAALNKKFNLGLDDTLVYGVLGLSAAHITLQTIIDSVKAYSIGKVASVITEVAADTTYKDLFPTIKSVHEGINKILADVQKNDNSQAFKDAAGAYLSIMDIIKSIEQPQPLPDIPVTQESA